MSRRQPHYQDLLMARYDGDGGWPVGRPAAAVRSLRRLSVPCPVGSIWVADSQCRKVLGATPSIWQQTVKGKVVVMRSPLQE